MTTQYRTKGGDLITFRIDDPDPRDPLLNSKFGNRKGYTVVRVIPFISGQEAGYLKITYIPKKTWVERFKYNLLKYLRYFQGHGIDLEDPTYLWQYTGISSEIPCPETAAERLVLAAGWLENSESYFAVEARADRRFWEAYAVDKPHIDFIRVHKEFQRNHVALAMYAVAAKWCTEHKMRLHASGNQTAEAEAAWEHMATLPGFHIKRTYYKDKEGKRKYRRYLVVD